MKKLNMDLNYGVKKDYSKLDEWQQKSNQYTVTLKYDGRQMTIPFFTGQGWSKDPEVADVVSCLVSDYSCIESSRDFYDFCDNLGYDSDSRKSLNTYNQCLNQSKKLEKLLGPDLNQIIKQYENY